MFSLWTKDKGEAKRLRTQAMADTDRGFAEAELVYSPPEPVKPSGPLTETVRCA